VADGPDLAPIAEIALSELTGRGPSTGAIGGPNHRAPIGAPVHRRPDADRLIRSAENHHFEAIANLKITAGRTGRIQQPHDRFLGEGRKNGQDRDEQ
jgi:hypothetical protein